MGSTNSLEETSGKVLGGVTTFWFLLICLGQWIFALHVVGFYVISGLFGNYENWNQALPHGYETGNVIGNVSVGAHVFMAALISFCGPLQLIPKVRIAWPRFHRWNGRMYVILALLMAASGLFLSLSGRKVVGDIYQHILICMNAALIIGFGIMAWRNAILKNFSSHRAWALRLFMAVSGVWLFRIGLMCWLVIQGKPVGFNMDSFSGPFLTFLSFSVYLVPVAMVELYIRAKEGRNVAYRFAASAGIFMVSLIFMVGIFGAAMGLWLPRLQL